MAAGALAGSSATPAHPTDRSVEVDPSLSAWNIARPLHVCSAWPAPVCGAVLLPLR